MNWHMWEWATVGKNDPLQVNNLFNNPDYRKIQEELTEKIRVHHRMMKTPKKFLPEEVW